MERTESVKITMYQIKKSTAPVRFDNPNKIEYKCLLCEKNFLTEEDIKYHLLMAHGGSEIHKHIIQRGAPLKMCDQQSRKMEEDLIPIHGKEDVDS